MPQRAFADGFRVAAVNSRGGAPGTRGLSAAMGELIPITAGDPCSWQNVRLPDCTCTDYFATEKILELLAEPMRASDLIAQLGVSRQRVYFLLNRLQSEGKVIRLSVPEVTARYLWIRTGVDVRAILRNRAACLSAAKVRVLSVLRPGAFHRIRDVADLLGAGAGAVWALADELASQGLAFTFRFGRRRFIGITSRGIAHPQRVARIKQAAVADFANSFGKILAAFVEVLAVLGEARTSELTAALADRHPSEKIWRSGQVIAHLRQRGLAEQVQDKDGKLARYRLTDAGQFAARLLALSRVPPSKADLERRIAEYRPHRARVEALRRASLRAEMPERALSRGQAAILDALRRGPAPTGHLARLVSEHFANRYSVKGTLDRLKLRGQVKVLGQSEARNEFVWALSGQ